MQGFDNHFEGALTPPPAERQWHDKPFVGGDAHIGPPNER